MGDKSLPIDGEGQYRRQNPFKKADPSNPEALIEKFVASRRRENRAGILRAHARAKRIWRDRGMRR